jgi:hypothetical protein
MTTSFVPGSACISGVEIGRVVYVGQSSQRHKPMALSFAVHAKQKRQRHAGHTIEAISEAELASMGLFTFPSEGSTSMKETRGVASCVI